jgi:hypothetical protein
MPLAPRFHQTARESEKTGVPDSRGTQWGTMYFAYFDESGDPGYVNSPTQAFVLSCILLHDKKWLQTLDHLVSFRRYLRDNFGLPPRAEIKASWLIRNKGPFKQLRLNDTARLRLYERAMRLQEKCGTTTVFAIVIDKSKIKKQTTSPREYAWQFAIQRLERFGTDNGENIHILPDEGHGMFITRMLRKMRRHHMVPSAFGAAPLNRPAINIVEDPSDRKSHASYFIQLADLNAYAAHRLLLPTRTVGAELWEAIGDARLRQVNQLTGGPPGIVVWPR